MQKYDSNCRSRTTWFDLAGTFCSLSEPEPLNAFESIEGLSNTEVDNLDSPAYSEEQSHILSPWNIYWTEAAAYGGGLELDNPVFGSNWTKYWGAHAWFDCVTPLVFQVYFHDHSGSLDYPNMDTQSDIMNYHSDFLIGSTFRICSPIGDISITLPSYQCDQRQQSSRGQIKYTLSLTRY